MSNITTHTRFCADLGSLKEAGIDVTVHSDDTLADIVLDEPGFGETYLSDLTEDEKAIFVELYRTNAELERLTREYMGAAIARVGDAIRTSDVHKPIHEAFRDNQTQMEFGSAENLQAFFRLQAKLSVLKSNLYWSLGERHNAHDFSIGVRTRYRAYKVASRV